MNYRNEEQLKKTVKSRILMINEDIKNNLTSLSLEDNFEQDEVSLYFESKNKALQYMQNAEELKLILQDLKEKVSSEIDIMADSIKLKVKKNDIVSELNAETAGIYFKSKLFLVDTPNFKVTEDSCYVNGTVYASRANIGGWTFANNVGTGSDTCQIAGGEIQADSAVCQIVDAYSMNLNPDYEGAYHIINMKNAELYSQSTQERENLPNFGDFTSWGAVTFENDLNVKNGNDLHCTALRAQGTSKYISIYCTEIVTEDETWSDARLKDNVKNISKEEAEMILKLRPVAYKLRKDNKAGVGLIAQELMPIAKSMGYGHLVSSHRGLYSVAYKELIPFMIKAIQENSRKIEEIKENGIHSV